MERRFQLLSMMRGVNGLVSARVLDRKTGEEHKVVAYDRIDTLIVTNIDIGARSLTLVDTGETPATLTVRPRP